jgi:hypothetical protein
MHLFLKSVQPSFGTADAAPSFEGVTQLRDLSRAHPRGHDACVHCPYREAAAVSVYGRL